MLDFNDSTLFISARSPFARRTRLALREHLIRHEERVLDVFKPNPELFAVNPLARVPAIRLKSGEELMDSEKILELFYRSHPQSPLLPQGDAEWVTVAQWSAIAVGFAEKTVEYYLETLRAETSRDAELLAEVKEVATRVLERFDGFIGSRETILPGRLTQADLDMGAALAYFTLRYSSQWQGKYANVALYLRKLEERDSFKATRPPPA
jgi:glutathione S-transferase